MKVLFAVSNEKMSEAIVKQYQKEYKEIITYKNVYYFNAILKELQRDKTYDRVVISEDLEQYVNSDNEQMDNFIFGRLDSISDEASNMKGEDIPIILICEERRTRGDSILIKLFGIGIYNAIIGNDRSINEVCRLIKRPRLKKEAKLYYKIDSEDVTYEKDDENDVSELEIQNICAHYKKIGHDEQKIVDSFDSIASQYNNYQLRIICNILPDDVKEVLAEKSPKYMQIKSFTEGVSDNVKVDAKSQKKSKDKKNEVEETGTSEKMIGTSQVSKMSEPVVIPSAMSTSGKRKIVSSVKKVEPVRLVEEKPQQIVKPVNTPVAPVEQPNKISNETEVQDDTLKEIEPIQPVKRGRGRPKKIVEEPVNDNMPKRKRGRPRKEETPKDDALSGFEDVKEENTLPGFEDVKEKNVLPGFEEEQEENVLPGFEEEQEESVLPGFEDEQEENVLPGFEEEQKEDVLPGFEEEQEENVLPGFEDVNDDKKEESDDSILPGFEQEEDILNGIEDKLPTGDLEDEQEEDGNQYTNVLNDLRKENHNQTIPYYEKKKQHELPKYEEIDIDKIIRANQKIVAFVGTSKNGTSFLLNNIAEILSTNNVNTAIVDLTQNRSSYYIYTKNEENLRIRANECFKNLREGIANGIEAHKNLTVYTSCSNIEDIEHTEPIIETLASKHDIILLDCDFETPERYFKYATEIYIIQSMDILTIQPLTAFLNKIESRGCFDQSKASVVLNMFSSTKYINENILIGGMSRYNDPEMTYKKDIFDRKTIRYFTVPFDRDALVGYLDGLVVCDVTLKNYNPKKSKNFLLALKTLSKAIYESNGKKKQDKYTPPSMKNI